MKLFSLVRRHITPLAVLCCFVFGSQVAQPQLGFAQNNPLNFGNNFFVTGDYVVAGAYGLNTNFANGLTKGVIAIPDLNPGIQPGPSSTCVVNVPFLGPTPAKNCVPAGAQIVAAVLYWQTVLPSTTPTIPSQDPGANGFFRPLFQGGPQTGYPIIGTNLPSQTTVSFSSENCSTCIVRTYRAEVRRYLPQDANGNVLANGLYEVKLASSYGGPPHTLGATLVLIYRVLSPNFPLNSIVIYDGAFTPGSPSFTITQKVQGFYDAAESPVSRLTHIVGGGNFEKYQTVSLGGNTRSLTALPSLYGSGHPAFPGWYGHWDNPTWTFPNQNGNNPVQDDDASATTKVVQTSSDNDEGGRLFWGAVIVSTTVQNSDGDGLLDAWKKASPPGYCDAAVNEGQCSGPGDPAWVDLPGATLYTLNPLTNGQKDLFVQLDHMCSTTDGSKCDGRYSFDPTPSGAVDMVKSAFLAKGIHVHVNPGDPSGTAIPEPTCTDTTSPPTVCLYPKQPGVVGWKSGIEFLKSQPLNYPDEATCESAGPACVRRFQHGRKDSYHYALFAHAMGRANWSFAGGTLTNSTGTGAGAVVQSGNTVTFYTSTGHGLVVSSTLGNGRVVIAGAITNPNLNGIFMVKSFTCPQNPETLLMNDCSVSNIASGPYTFTIDIGTSVSAQPSYTQKDNPNLSAASGQAGKGSGFSDIGGADTLVTLGLWGDPSSPTSLGQTVTVQAGTFMHELGHTLGLTHGGFYYDTPNSYVPTVEANCKSNYQSVMNYMFQVDLLGPSGVLDFSSQQLSPLNESALTTLITANGPIAFPTTSWYDAVPQLGVGTKAKRHCDNTPRSINDHTSTMYFYQGGATSLGSSTLTITPSLSTTTNLDINYDGKIETSLRGYNDWGNIDLRLIGGTSSDSFGGPGALFGGPGGLFGGPGGLFGGPGALFGGPGGLFGGPGALFGGPGGLFGGPGGLFGGPGGLFGGPGTSGGEIDFDTANSVTRPPRNLMASEEVSARIIDLSWTAPTFGQIAAYRIYRSADGGATFPLLATVFGTQLTYKDTVTCNPANGYQYFVTAVLAGTFVAEGLPAPGQGQESVPSNIAPSSGPKLTGCYTNAQPPTVALTGFSSPAGGATFTQGDSIPITWALQTDNTGVPVTNTAANRVVAIGPIPHAGACSQLATPPVFLKTSPYPLPFTILSSSGTGITLNNNQFTLTWTPSEAGCYFLELDLDSGQFEQTATALTVLISVAGPQPQITTFSLPDGVVGTAYNSMLTSRGGDAGFHWTLDSGLLPPGIMLDPASGALSGTPTTPGTYTFTARVTDSELDYGTRTLTLRVFLPLVITTASPLPTATQGISYGPVTFTATGGFGSYTWTSVTVDGLTLNSSGVFSGIPTATGTFVVNATVTDSASPSQTKSKSLTLNVSLAPPTNLVATALSSGSVNLTWSPSTSTVVGYNVYRATVSGGQTTTLGSVGAATLLFTDSTGVGGQTYYYVVTAFDSNVESVFSNQASATVAIAPLFFGQATDPLGDGLPYAVFLSDGTFANANWSAAKVFDSTPSAGAIFAAGQVAIGGNPDAYRQVTMTYGQGSIIVGHINNQAVYNPASQGAITSIGYSYDVQEFNPPFAGAAVNYALLLFQNGTYYVPTNTDTFFNTGTWSTFTFNNLKASDFSTLYQTSFQLPGTGPAHPDFSSSGAPITFGYYSANTNTGTPPVTTMSGVDNWRVNVAPLISPDLVWGSVTTFNDGSVKLMVRYASGTFNSSTTLADFLLDTDQSASTGSPGSNSGCIDDAGNLGTDYLVVLKSGFANNQAQIYKAMGGCNQYAQVGTAPVTIFTDGMEVTVPLSLLTNTAGTGVSGPATSGPWNFKVVTAAFIGTGPNGGQNFSGVIDTMPNIGLAPVPTASVPLPIAPPSGIVSWWPGDGNFTDIISGSNGTPVGGVAFAPSEVGQAFTFNGVDGAVQAPHNANQNTGNQIAIEAWVYPRTSGQGRPIAQKRSSTNIGGYTFETTDSPANGLQFVIWIGGRQNLLQTPAGALTLGTWQHVAATFDGATMNIYVNGGVSASMPVAGTIDPVLDPFVIGQNVANTAFDWDGLIDEVTLYNRALTSAEIQAIFNAGSAGKAKP